jgi:hypothetical protein
MKRKTTDELSLLKKYLKQIRRSQLRTERKLKRMEVVIMANLADLTLKVVELQGSATDYFNVSTAKFQELQDLITQLKDQVANGADTAPVIAEVQKVIDAIAAEKTKVEAIVVS